MPSQTVKLKVCNLLQSLELDSVLSKQKNQPWAELEAVSGTIFIFYSLHFYSVIMLQNLLTKLKCQDTAEVHPTTPSNDFSTATESRLDIKTAALFWTKMAPKFRSQTYLWFPFFLSWNFPGRGSWKHESLQITNLIAPYSTPQKISWIPQGETRVDFVLPFCYR